MSSEGNPLLTIVADTCGRHDTLGGACAAESNQVRYDLNKKHMHNCRDTFLLELALHHPLFALELCRRNAAVEHPISQQLQGRAPVLRSRVNIVRRMVQGRVGIRVIANSIQDTAAFRFTARARGATVDNVLEEMR